MSRAAVPVLTRRELGRATLARQLLLERAPLDAAEAVARIGGMQAQEPRPPFVGLWSRLAGFSRAGLHAALEERRVVRGMAMRATLHLQTAADHLATRAALAPVMERAVRVLGARAAGLDRDAVLAAARTFLDEEPRTFAQTRDHLAALFPDVDARALGYTVRTALPLVMVPSDDRWSFPADARFTPTERWLGEPVDPAAGPEALVRRHLAAFGPSSATDVQAWSGLGGLAAVLKRLAPDLAVFRDERGRTLYDLPDAPRPDPEVPCPPRFLPDFDALVLAHDDRTRVIADAHRARLVTRNLRVRATVLWDGEVAGTWTLERAGRAAVLRIAPFARLPRGATAALRDEAGAARAVHGRGRGDARRQRGATRPVALTQAWANIPPGIALQSRSAAAMARASSADTPPRAAGPSRSGLAAMRSARYSAIAARSS